MATKKASTTAQLLACYNRAARSLGRKQVKRFADRRTAERRVREIGSALGRATTKTARGSAPLGQTRGLRFDLPGRPARDRVAPREGSMRARLLGMLQGAGKKGVDFEKLHGVCGIKNPKSTRDAIRLLSRKNGFAIKGSHLAVRLG